ncbi:MAG: hypothetical protein H9864_05395 [Candidatus Faecalibacterium intestinavium]|uniref:Zn-finger containing protein n=1 Tax=Candidatus Faecalibacterium intestinavium TaxID=2838580 RepID=A0A9E2NQQ1_9FIRM|nr:hypothetical protein [Candidatus Faecalibacterium intestinavium]
MREKLRRFMAGRYGVDALNQFLSIASIALLLVALVSRLALFTWVAFALLIWCNYRTFSRNISRRTEENYKFCTLKDRLSGRLGRYRRMWADRSTHRYYRCPQCRQQLRVPRGRGRIEISCPRCGTRFIKKT